jgi:hypothetical protein
VNLGSFTFLCAVAYRGWKNGKVPKFEVARVGKSGLCLLETVMWNRLRVSGNDLRANEGRETKALNCKPNTNLKEISELSNYSKTSGFRLHAVISSAHAMVLIT